MPRPKKSRVTIEESDSDDGSSANEAEVKTTTKRQASESSSGSDSDWNNKSKSPKKRKVAAKRPVRKARAPSSSSEEEGEDDSDSEEEEEGKLPDNEQEEEENEAAKSDPEDGEVADSGSDDDDDDSDSEFDDGYDENLMGDADDRKRLFTMTEVEREKIIFERLEKREVNRTRKEIKSKLKAQQKVKKGKSGASASKAKTTRRRPSMTAAGALADTAVSQRSQERRKTVETQHSKKRDAMEHLKAQRNQRRSKDQITSEAKAKKEKADSSDSSSDEEAKDGRASQSGSSSSSSSSSGSSSSGSGSDSGDESRSGSQSDSDMGEDMRKTAVAFVSTKEQMERIRLSRFRLAKWVHSPFFKKVVIGCFVRVGIGMHDSRRIYRIAEVTDVVETAKVYEINGQRTNKGLRLNYAGAERVYRMEFISDSACTESEFFKWKESVLLGGGQLPTVTEAEAKVKQIKDCHQHVYKTGEIDAMVKAKSEFKKTPFNFAMKKSDLIKEKEAAEADGEQDTVHELNKQLDELESKASELDKKRLGNLSSITYINQRNRERNIKEAENALKREVAEMKNAKADVFTRRQCRPTMITKAKDAAELYDANDGTLATRQEEAQAKIDSEAAAANKDNLIVKPVDDLFDMHNFDIKIDLDVPMSTGGPTPTLPRVESQPRIAGPKRSLNLSDYKKRRGLI